MKVQKKLVCLASYPKSGNTWFRAFLANLASGQDAPVNVNQLDIAPVISLRTLFDEFLGFESSDLSPDEIDAIRPDYCRHLASTSTTQGYIKVHDAYTIGPRGEPLFPPDAVAAVIYIIRNPLDVCVSLAHHSGNTRFDWAATVMGNESYAIAGSARRQTGQLRQRLQSWSRHVLSWVDAPGHRVHIIRYEDMINSTQTTFEAAARFLNLTADAERIQRAIRNCSFSELQRQESSEGFRERARNEQTFFREGRIGSWRISLSSEQVAKLVTDHTEIMHRFGYIFENGDLVCREMAFA